ncbi:MAG: hypothetical protein J6J75_08135 [Alistipes sp.]|nr:hypothetical protein [Alistipes sp.]
MKKLFLSMSLMLAALTLTNCTKDAAEDKAIVDNGKGFSFTANIDGVGDTKATLEGVKTVWEAGDQIGLGGSIDNLQENKNVQLLAFDYVSGNTFNNAEASYADAQTFYAIYPYTASNSGFSGIYPADHASRANQTTVFYVVGSKGEAIQNGASAAHIPAVSPMYYVSEGAVAPAALAVQLHHTTSLMKFTVTNGEDAALTVKSLKLTVPSTIKICGTFYLNVATGELISSGANYTYSAQTVSVENAPALAKGESFDVYMAVAPFELAADDAISVVVTATDGTTCTIEKKMAAATAFEAGKLNTATVNFVKDAVAETPMTVSELAQAIEAGTTTFAGKRVQGFVSAVAAGDTDNFSKGTVILTDNSGNEYSAVKFYNNAATGLAQFSGLAIGDELEIDLSNAGVSDYNGKQITGVTVDNVINGEAISVDNSIIAKEISIADYKANFAAYNNVYLKFVDVTPTVAGIFTGTIAFTDGTNEVNAYGKTSKYGDWDNGKIEIGKVKGTLYGVGQMYQNAPQLVPVTVADIEAFAAPFTIDKESVAFTADGGTETVKVTLKEGYTLGAVENTAAWLTVTPASDGTILFTAAANTETVARDVNVTVAVMKDGAAFTTITIAVSQKEFGNTTVEETVTFVPGDLTLTNGAIIGEKDGVSVNHVQGASTSKLVQPNSDWRIYKSSDFTVTAPGKITKIIFTYAGTDKSKWVDLVVNSGTFERTDNTATWTGDAASVNFKASNGQARIAKMEVTYTK